MLRIGLASGAVRWLANCGNLSVDERRPLIISDIPCDGIMPLIEACATDISFEIPDFTCVLDTLLVLIQDKIPRLATI
ncbi:unnamed protein product [Rotaria sp. Silwood1]|nr:unnamed protein product [Rotaria sp. Silwood1]